MKNTIGELSPVKVALAVAMACALAFFLYSRVSFKKEENPTDRTVILERELQQTKDASDKLRQRIEEIERRLPEPVPPAVPKAKVPQKATKGK